MEIQELYNIIKDDITEIKSDIRFIKETSIPHIHERIDGLIKNSSNSSLKYFFEITKMLIVAVLVLVGAKTFKLF